MSACFSASCQPARVADSTVHYAKFTGRVRCRDAALAAALVGVVHWRGGQRRAQAA
ncbi:unnamed protein product (plasmid) [Mycetohabitans rhizoxinica HKI 454]|uniref:Uncharacterized protein n=1 Tax=Mycetohabitans rhizoxinica (strain DSM 19002 / CIP 109453 / HKI 454) TaxID=882378 RepID=E5AUL2_MYCRK|nr:unnamed protein product [Mycetohabitans rhizoxinica HKI 454]